MSGSVGRVDLDLGLNYKQFNKELNGISGTATSRVGGAFKKLGVIIAGAFAVKGLVGFGKAASGLASDLVEVQNVVDVTFGSMAEHINQFSKSALTSFGLSELSAKRYASTLGAMMKSSGLTGAAVTKLSMDLTGLAGDMASFYNLATDDAFNKIRSGISGETEPLKQLGINMSVANMEAFALAQGMKKSYQQMTQAEQVLLRYNYLIHASKDAQGDVIRTSDSWANQTRLLSEQWKTFKGTLGQGFINVMRPVVALVNQFIGRLQVAAQYFRAFTEVIFGLSKAGGSAAAVSEDVSSGLGEVSADATKAGKAMKGLLGGFDQLNVVGSSASDALGGAAEGMAGLGAGDMSMELPPIEVPDVNTDKFETQIRAMVERVKTTMSTMFGGDYGSKLREAFSGIVPAIQPIINAQIPISNALAGIGQSATRLKDEILKPLADYILLDFVPNITTGFLESFVPVFSDAVVSAVQGFATSFQTATNTMVELFNTTWLPAIDSVKLAFLDAFPAIAETIQSVLDNTVKPFVDFFINGFVLPISTAIQETLVPILSQVTVWAIQEFVKWFQWAGGLLNEIYTTVIEPVFKLLATIVLDTLDIVAGLWDEYGQTYLDNISELMGGIRDLFQQLWDVILKPIIEPFLVMLSWLWDKHLKGLVEELGRFVMKLVNGVLEITNKFILPIIKLLVDRLGPTFANVFALVVDVLGTVLAVAIDITKGIVKALGGVIDFLVGIFTGDWEKAWKGIGAIFEGIFDGVVGIFKGAINLMIDSLNFLIRQMNKIKFDMPDWVPVIGGKDFGLNIPEVPKLAKGGLVAAPTLAMVGDNKNARVDPEVISPLSKLKDMMAASNQGLIEVLFMILDAIERLDLNVEMDGELLTRQIRARLDKENNRVGSNRVVIGGASV